MESLKRLKVEKSWKLKTPKAYERQNWKIKTVENLKGENPNSAEKGEIGKSRKLKVENSKNVKQVLSWKGIEKVKQVEKKLKVENSKCV